MKVVQYFKHTRNLNAYVKKYKRLTHALMCIFILCAAFVLTSHAGAETHDLQNYTYVSYSQSSDLDDEETLHLLTVDESTTAPVYVINDHNNITSVKVSTDKNSEGVENGTITPNTNYLKIKVEFKGIHAEVLENKYNGSFRYNLPEFFRSTSTTKRPILDKNNNKIGTIHVENGQAIITYTKEYLAKLSDNATLAGSFFLEGEADLTQVDNENGSIDATFPSGNIKLEYGPSYIEKYSDVKVDKAYTKDPNSDYIKYTLKVSAGPDGSQNVYIVDKFTNNKNLVTYAGDISTTPTELSATEDGQKPYETKTTDTSGKIYLTNQPTSDKEVPDPITGNTSITKPGSIVWSIDKLAPNETRTLTYYVKLTDKSNIRNQNITNKASVLNKKGDETYLKGSSEKTFIPTINYANGMTKNIVSNNGKQYTKDADGNYIVQYRLNFRLNANSNYPLKNYAFFDYLNYSGRSTDEKMLPYISYIQDSVELHQVVGSTDTTIDSSHYKVEWETDGTNYKENWTDGNPKRFKLSGTDDHPITIYPGDSYYVTYKLKIKPEVYAAMQSGQVTIKNVYANDSDNAKYLAGMLDRTMTTIDLNDYTWIHKVKDNDVTTNDQTIQMNSEVYVKKNGSYEKDSSVTSFEVPKGSYKYTVNLNKSQNQFDITHATLKDALSSDIMHYIGYVKITAYKYDESTNTYKDKESKWVKIDKQTSFELKLSEFGWSNSYGYRFDYYAQTEDLSEIGQIKVTNTFTLNGNVVKGDQTFNFTNKTASQTTQVNGFYNLNVNKSAWYYERPVENATTWENGTFYWVIEVNGSAIREGTKIRDVVVKENNITDSYLHTDSVAGIYQGKLTKQVGECKNYQEFIDANTGLVDKSKLFNQEYTNSKNFSGNNKSELTLTAKETIKLGDDENIYIIIKTEPSQIPVVNRATFTYKNEVLLKDTTDTSFNKYNDASQSLYGGGDLLKEFNCTFSYDGKEAKILQSGTDTNINRIATNVLKQTTGNGIYASWVFKVNYAGDLKGDYRVLEDIPEGMELGYIRIKWHGNQAGSVVSKTMNDLGSDWTQYSNTARNDNNQNQATTYYYNKKTNKALIKLGAFVNKHTRDECSIDVQVVCRVTDSKVLLGGQSKTFANKVTLQDEEGGEQLATSSSTAAIEKNSLDKSHPETFNGQTIKYTITANTLSQKLPSNDGNKLTLVDELGDNLELDMTTIDAKDDAGNSVEIEKAFDPETNTLEISIPNEKKIIITYTVTVNIAPDTSTKVSNKVYWKSYGSDGGKNDVIPDFKYNLNAGGSTTSTENPELSIKKIDQDNANMMNGVTFDIYECELKGDTITRSNKTTSGQTENGVLTVEAPFVTSYNTIYEVKERDTPEGYMKDDSSYYIICVDKENSDDYTDYVKQCIAYFDKQSNKKYKVAYLSKDFNLTVYNSQLGIVVKKAFINNAAGTSHKPVSGTYTFGLYDNSEGTGSPLQVKTITYSTGETEEKTTKFINLDLNTDYYVFELDDEGNPITSTSQEVTVNKLPYVVDYKVKGNSTSKAVVGDEVIVTNSLRTKKLPSSGSRLTLIYRQLGLAMVGVSSIVLLIIYKNRGKEIKDEEIGK
ncbi:isopeptide-forming domain-containing fimbrial protein [uncultured Catenibacterium sp.]|uniref:isopeptide-forming domain-containing fimbrial protein n=3 Tax=uncultured Catenibacterium sp. TaxID=286142 RepID=UPI0026011CEF|nr:isopeptide-forming domain-containing fimbrial protein [uncultured Catenibacterium sp.]